MQNTQKASIGNLPIWALFKNNTAKEVPKGHVNYKKQRFGLLYLTYSAKLISDYLYLIIHKTIDSYTLSYIKN